MAPADFRCAVWTRAKDPDPIGTAPRFDDLLLVEVPLPWPADVADMPQLAAAFEPAGSTRVMAVVPENTRKNGDVLVTTYRRAGDACSYEGTDVVVPAAGLGEALSALVAGQDLEGSPAPREMLLCSHGSRDRCCGSFGTRLHIAAKAEPWDGIRIRRVSHTGGHRFAPTGMSLPDGRLWAYLDLGVLGSIITRREPVGPVVAHYRGVAALSAALQILERAAFARYGWEVLDWPVVSAHQSDRLHVLVLRGRNGPVTISAEVSETRQIPILACGEPPEAATKVSTEFTMTNLLVSEAD